MTLLDHDSKLPVDVMLCEIAKHRCDAGLDAKFGLCDDPKKLRVGFMCFDCKKVWDVGLCSDLKPRKFNPILKEYLRTTEKRMQLLRILRLSGYLMVQDIEYLEDAK